MKKCFDSIEHHKLMKVLQDKISDRKFTRLIWKSLRAGYLDFHQSKHNLIGSFQGSIISPILSNIFLHQLDVQVENLRIRFQQAVEKSSQRNPYTQH